MKQILVVLTLTLLSSSVQARKTPKFDSQLITDVHVYKYFPKRGFTTAGLFYEFKKLDSLLSPSRRLDDEDINGIRKILSKAKVQRHFQSKFPPDPIFGYFLYDGEVNKIVIYDDFVINLTRYQNYIIKNTEDSAKLHFIVQKSRGGAE